MTLDWNELRGSFCLGTEFRLSCRHTKHPLGAKSVNMSNCDISDVLTCATGAEDGVGAVNEVKGA